MTIQWRSARFTFPNLFATGETAEDRSLPERKPRARARCVISVHEVANANDKPPVFALTDNGSGARIRRKRPQ